MSVRFTVVHSCLGALVAAALMGCSGSGGVHSSDRVAVDEAGEGQGVGMGPSWMVDLKAASGIEQIVPRLASKRVVYVGETHTRYEDHLAQLEIIRRMVDADPDLAIGMEYFQTPFQPYLDAYVARELDEAGLLRKTEYYERWRFDWRLYRPILGFARRHGIPLVALNVPKELTGRVGQVGIEGLTDEERARLPSPIPAPDAAYRARLEQSFRHHPKSAQRDFERFVQVQSVWDEGMAQRVAEYLSEHPTRRMVVLAGSGHLVYGQGIPDRVRRRSGVEAAVVLPGVSADDLSSELADFVLWTAPAELPPQGLLGIFLAGDEGGVQVSGLAQGSPAQQAGLLAGDRIAALDGAEVADLTDLKLALLGRGPGEQVAVTVSRAATDGGREHKQYAVTLQGPPARQSPHSVHPRSGTAPGRPHRASGP
jgi:uncharacterized iron-regulated protein